MTEYNIISTIEGNAPKQKNICCFAHYDKDGIIDTYVIHYLKQIKEQLKCEIIFTSTAPTLRNPEDITDLCSQIIHRENEYYDFGSYLYGYSLINPAEYDNILFANDSVYGAFADISHLPAKMQEFDIWGITDSIIPSYHIQSYFLWFGKTAFAFLDKFIAQYQHSSDCTTVVANGEVGISKKALSEGLSLSSAWNYEDTTLNIISENELRENFPNQQSFLDKALFRGLARHKFKQNCESQMWNCFSNNNLIYWREMIEDFDFPFLKSRMLKGKKYIPIHLFQHDKVIRNKFPEYDINLIRKHLHRVG